MSTCYKNFPVVITYEDLSTETIYANSVSLNESVALETAESLGAKGASSVFNNSAAQGSISIESYLSEDMDKTLDLVANNSQNLTIQVGKYTTPAPCILSSMSVNITMGEPLTLSREYSYYGSVTVGSDPAVEAPEITPAIPEGVSLSGYENIGGSNIITDVSWSLNQNYQEINLLGNVTPVIAYSSSERTMDINGEGLTEALMESPSAGCVVPPKEYNLTISGCGGTTLGTLTMTKGYMQSRSSTVNEGEVESNSVSIVQFF